MHANRYGRGLSESRAWVGDFDGGFGASGKGKSGDEDEGDESGGE